MFTKPSENSGRTGFSNDIHSTARTLLNGLPSNFQPFKFLLPENQGAKIIFFFNFAKWVSRPSLKIRQVNFSEQLIRWYEENRRALPWRNTKDPYRIWLSEIILQQTRVAQGLPYYERFLERFPSVKELALASEEEVLKYWQGLGYYSRARNLHAAAKIIHTRYKDVFPSAYPEIRALPGIGDYTAAAIASFAYKLVYPVVDGNVIRFMCRLEGIFEAAGSPSCTKRIREMLQQRIDPLQPGLFNQAIMEFGALGCTPASPLCLQESGTCPFRTQCYALHQKVIDRLPVKKKKEILPVLEIHYLLITDARGNLWLHKRGYEALWRGMFDLPSLPEGWNGNNKLREAGAAEFLKHYTQVLTHRRLEAYFYRIPENSAPARKILKMQENCLKICPQEISRFAVPRVIERFLQDFNII